MKAEIRFAAAVLLLLGITLFQMAGLPQPVTGPAVNGALYGRPWLGPWYAVAVECVPRGGLRTHLTGLWLMIPFIVGQRTDGGPFALAGRRFVRL